jgi:hypothetical protein
MASTMKPAYSRDCWRRGRRASLGFLIATMGVGLVPQIGRAELIYFRKGGDAQLPARIVGDHVVLTMPDGEIKLARDLVRKFVPVFWPRT